ncbi:hypothetical protein Scep_011374 [Stephania cephalantha]|uniref:Targeting protein for Xklp2 n=1 Tax=Stephania cephalantha TaxID=152367 RepID=A0AAP0P8U8_9MAGN
MAISEGVTMIDEVYEFSAPRFFDFVIGESDEEARRAENWFESALGYAPSPFMPKIKARRSVQIPNLCDFSDDAEGIIQKQTGVEETPASCVTEDAKLVPVGKSFTRLQSEPAQAEAKKEEIRERTDEHRISIGQEIPALKEPCVGENGARAQDKESTSSGRDSFTLNTTVKATAEMTSAVVVSINPGPELCTPKPQMIPKRGGPSAVGAKNNLTAKKIASLVRNPSALRPKDQSQLSQTKFAKPNVTKSAISSKKTVGGPDFVHENQAIKRQKLDGGRSRQILNFKPHNLTHKSKPGLSNATTSLSSSISKASKEERKVYVRETPQPFISAAELVKRFQSGTRGLELPNRNSSASHADGASIIQRRPKLTLTRPKEPDFETTHRARPIKVKSSAELEEEMMASIPKFKARPINKKILEAPSLPALPRSTPHLPEFQEFHFRTMERAHQNVETSTVASTESFCQTQWNPNKLTEPKMPRLQTAMRARPPKIKTSQELEKEELEKVPTFKARPLNKKIFESKGEMGVFCNSKRQITIPHEFHFATDERIPPTRDVADLFDRLSIKSESSRHDHQLPRITTPNPFHLHTEERGAEKEKKFEVEIMQKQLEEERARIPRANPYPYTTDYPVIPPKPEAKECTKPEPFQLESLVRHEEELQREMEERQRTEREEAQMRVFKALPILKEDPIPLPEKTRIPLTQVEEFPLHVDHRAGERAEFDKRVKEKEMIYKRYREEYESAKMVEEEKALKQMRRTMVPHARPVPNFSNPFLPQKSSKETTKAKSPKLRVVKRGGERRVTGLHLHPATSAAAANMR